MPFLEAHSRHSPCPGPSRCSPRRERAVLPSSVMDRPLSWTPTISSRTSRRSGTGTAKRDAPEGRRRRLTATADRGPDGARRGRGSGTAIVPRGPHASCTASGPRGTRRAKNESNSARSPRVLPCAEQRQPAPPRGGRKPPLSLRVLPRGPVLRVGVHPHLSPCVGAAETSAQVHVADGRVRRRRWTLIPRIPRQGRNQWLKQGRTPPGVTPGVREIRMLCEQPSRGVNWGTRTRQSTWIQRSLELDLF